MDGHGPGPWNMDRHGPGNGPGHGPGHWHGQTIHVKQKNVGPAQVDFSPNSLSCKGFLRGFQRGLGQCNPPHSFSL